MKKMTLAGLLALFLVGCAGPSVVPDQRIGPVPGRTPDTAITALRKAAADPDYRRRLKLNTTCVRDHVEHLARNTQDAEWVRTSTEAACQSVFAKLEAYLTLHYPEPLRTELLRVHKSGLGRYGDRLMQGIWSKSTRTG